MSKDTPILAARAKDMYVKKPLTFKEIAARLGVSERTVRSWKDKDGTWEREREAYIESRTSLHEELYDFLREVMLYIRGGWKNGNKIDASCWKAFYDLLQFVAKPQDYEAVRAKKETDKTKLSNRDLALSILTAMGAAENGPDYEDDGEDEDDEEDEG